MIGKILKRMFSDKSLDEEENRIMYELEKMNEELKNMARRINTVEFAIAYRKRKEEKN